MNINIHWGTRVQPCFDRYPRNGHDPQGSAPPIVIIVPIALIEFLLKVHNYDFSDASMHLRPRGMVAYHRLYLSISRFCSPDYYTSNSKKKEAIRAGGISDGLETLRRTLVSMDCVLRRLVLMRRYHEK